MMGQNFEVTTEKSRLLHSGLGLSVVGIIVIYVFGPGLSFTLGLIATAIGFIFFGVGLRSRIMRKNPDLANIVVVTTSVASVILIAWYLLF